MYVLYLVESINKHPDGGYCRRHEKPPSHCPE
jgi:hypothetical protein